MAKRPDERNMRPGLPLRPDERNMRPGLPMRPDERNMRPGLPLHSDDRGMVWEETKRPTPGKKQGKSALSGYGGMQDQLGLLAQQLNNGFGGGVLGNMKYLESFYSPVQMPGAFDYASELDKADKKARQDKNGKSGQGLMVLSGNPHYYIADGQSYRRYGSR